MTMIHTVPTAGRLARRGLTLAVALGGLAACDLSVSNPGPTQDAFLADSLSLTAQVAGVGFTLGDGMNYLVLHSAVATRELFPTGQSGQFGIEPRNWVGLLVTEEQATPWNLVSRARWLGDQATARLQKVLGATAFAKHPQAAQVLIWRAFTYRVLGEAMCVSIIDGGPATPARDNLVRAESTFTAAIAVAAAANNTTLINAGYAGRAQVRVALADWTGAVADAGRVPTSFAYKMPYYANVDEFGYNRTMWSSTSQSFFKATSAWNTWYAQYYDETKDPRVPYTLTTLKGSGAFPPVGAVNWWPQSKYATNTAGVNLASGREARLIEAEAALRGGNIAGAMTLIDANRASAGAPVAARPATITDAWTLLKRERGIELWLEGRRLADLRRWAATSTPGALDPKETPGAASYLEGQSSCFPVSRQEIDTNKNNVGNP